ncbi:MAG: pentapeptide repeat-containing protein [Humidesulfovibrio sp.]|uniref:pentapeptide repeat-containing protein n=1 Tax=Humidesulfovibrio sp. TaxID=2910988 RepID=UPI0027F14E19|nr:pentapeptide repeat-containing protein [Humidesulfovibrio sp.]MDQ7834664.1 pentapeptide repeat-containing protein [Humidesulfovibrio sp.]
MPCCKCEEHEWPDPQPVIYTDEADRKEYCLFHAPADKKGISVDEFNERVFARIAAVKARNEAEGRNELCDLSGAIIPDFTTGWFDKPLSLPPLKFDGAIFCGVAYIEPETRFDHVSFLSTTFNDVACFESTEFIGRATFDNATFSKETVFYGAKFHYRATFDGVSFRGKLYFQQATFNSEASFRNAALSEEADFDLVKFFGWADFSLARFGGAVLFRQVTCSQSVYFEMAKFGDVADFTLTHFFGTTNCTNTTFDGLTSFEQTTFNNVTFYSSEFVGQANFTGAIFNRLTTLYRLKAHTNALLLHSLSASSLSIFDFTSMETECLSFKGCNWPERLLPEVIYGPDHKACEELYRSLKQKAASEHDQPMVSKWHYREKLMGLKMLIVGIPQAMPLLDEIEEKTTPAWRKVQAAAQLLRLAPGLLLSLNFWYWAVSGYGEREKRAGVFLAFLAVLPFVLNAFPHPIESFWFSTQVNDALSHFPFAKDIPGQGGWLRLGKGISQLLITLQATIFAFALRNRFRR